MNGYNFFSFNRLVLFKLFTIIFFNKSRLIRFPVYIRGKKYIDFGKNLTTGVGLRIEAFPINNKKCIFFGNNVQINDYVHIGAVLNISIGNNVLIASKVYISDHNHGEYTDYSRDSSPNVMPAKRPLSSKRVIIEDNVWIGESVCILPGVTIGSGSVIGAGSVVTKDVKVNTIVVGNPAKPIKYYDQSKSMWISI